MFLKMEELEAELVKFNKKVVEFEDQLVRKEEEIKFLQNQYKVFLKNLKERER